MSRHGLFVCLLLCLISSLFSVRLLNQPTDITQPDGSVLHCYASGDEYFNYLHDADGYPIMRGDDGYLYYALQQDGNYIPSPYRVGSVDPRIAGFDNHVQASPEVIRAAREHFRDPNAATRTQRPTSGRMNNLSVLISFSDQTEFSNPRQSFDNVFNSLDPTVHSLEGYYWTVSYNALTIHTTFYPECEMNTNLSYHDSHPRSYYCAYNADSNPDGYHNSNESTQREHTLLVNAVNAIASQVPDTLNIDANDDGNVDNVSFIIRGQNEGWAELLWGHRWTLYSQEAYINDKRVYDYTFVPESQSDPYTHCHEMFHSLGAPDLYHYNGGIDPVGAWDLMDGGYVHMSSYMKFRYGHWIDSIPEITESGLYTLNSLLEPTGNCYKIVSPNSSTEYFLLEYRKYLPSAYEIDLPSSGLIIYRINTELDGQGNADGPPDEIYAYRPGGTTDAAGNLNNAAFSVDYNRTEFNQYSNPTCFLSDGSDGGIYIHQVGTCGDSISFYVDPQIGFLNGTITTDNPEDDLTTATINLDGCDFHPSENGTFSYATDEGTYTITVTMPFHSTQTATVTLLPLQEVSVSLHLTHLDAPTNLQASVNGLSTTFTWEFNGTSEDFQHFEIYRQIVDHPWGRVAVTNELTYTLQVTHNQNYRFYVNATYSNGVSDSSNVVELFFLSADDPTQPTLKTALVGNYPNPFNPITTIRYSLAKEASVHLALYDVRGRQVAVLVNNQQLAGVHSVTWNGKNATRQPVASGVYFARFIVDGKTVGTRKLLLMK